MSKRESPRSVRVELGPGPTAFKSLDKIEVPSRSRHALGMLAGVERVVTFHAADTLGLATPFPGRATRRFTWLGRGLAVDCVMATKLSQPRPPMPATARPVGLVRFLLS